MICLGARGEVSAAGPAEAVEHGLAWAARVHPDRWRATVSVAAVEAVVEGRVQGVGYRAFAQRRAQERGLTGYAVNLHDGRVRIRVEGSADAIDAYVRDLETGPPLARVERVSVEALPYTGRYREFSVRLSEPW